MKISLIHNPSVCQCVYLQETFVNQESHMYQYNSVDWKKGMPSKWFVTDVVNILQISCTVCTKKRTFKEVNWISLFSFNIVQLQNLLKELSQMFNVVGAMSALKNHLKNSEISALVLPIISCCVDSWLHLSHSLNAGMRSTSLPQKCQNNCVVFCLHCRKKQDLRKLLVCALMRLLISLQSC